MSSITYCRWKSQAQEGKNKGKRIKHDISGGRVKKIVDDARENTSWSRMVDKLEQSEKHISNPTHKIYFSRTQMGIACKKEYRQRLCCDIDSKIKASLNVLCLRGDRPVWRKRHWLSLTSVAFSWESRATPLTQIYMVFLREKNLILSHPFFIAMVGGVRMTISILGHSISSG